MRPVHVVVVGCGRVGSELALRLTASGHSVAVVDKRRSAFRRLPKGFGGTLVEGLGFDRQHLEQAGIREASALAAVTSGDNSNILSARVARETFEVPHVVARIYDPARAEIYERLGIPTVATVTWTTDQVYRRIFPEKTVVDWTDPTGTLTLVERDLPPGWEGRSLAALDGDGRFRLVALTRAGEGRLAMSGVVGQEGDVLHILVRVDATEDLEAVLAAGPEAG
ncbi:MAG TPA: TrkA family potassium uptake protein [Acidimicrobiales bacterium]|jgi:trk system potassium uptake protein TrkA|nr:TrkA family potassium uptake protein [Acidimicrobiales bacterium]